MISSGLKRTDSWPMEFAVISQRGWRRRTLFGMRNPFTQDLWLEIQSWTGEYPSIPAAARVDPPQCTHAPPFDGDESSRRAKISNFFFVHDLFISFLSPGFPWRSLWFSREILLLVGRFAANINSILLQIFLFFPSGGVTLTARSPVDASTEGAAE